MSTSGWLTGASKRDVKATRIQVKAEQDRLNAENEMELRARQAELDRQERQHAMQARDEQKARRNQARTAEKAARAATRAKRTARVNAALPNIGRRVMIVGPIVAPMSVAWIGQIGFAQHTLGWPLIGAIVFAAAWEMTTAFVGWMYHQARDDGDSGTIFRIATWFFAGTAGLMNYWHALPTDGSLTDPTPKAASFGLMSLTGIAVWELYTLLIHRKALRLAGKLPEPRPRFGLARWTQYPYTTWLARSLSIKHGYTTVDAAWSMALAQKDRKARVKAAKNAAKATKSGRTPVHITVVHGPRTRISMRPLTTWTQPPTVWIPTVGSQVVPGAKNHPALVVESTPELTSGTTLESTPESTRDPVARTTSESTRETSPEPTAESRGEPTPETTPKSTRETTPEPSRRTSRRSIKSRAKAPAPTPRRTRDELRVELEAWVAEHYRNGGGEIKVAPLATELKATRKTVRELLNEMSVRPIRKAGTS